MGDLLTTEQETKIPKKIKQTISEGNVNPAYESRTATVRFSKKIEVMDENDRTLIIPIEKLSTVKIVEEVVENPEESNRTKAKNSRRDKLRTKLTNEKKRQTESMYD